MGKIGYRKRKGGKKHSKADVAAAAAASASFSDSDDESVEFVPDPTVDQGALFDEAMDELTLKDSLSIGEGVRRRQAFAWQFIEVFKCPPPEDWKGPDGAIPKIKKILNIPLEPMLITLPKTSLPVRNTELPTLDAVKFKLPFAR
jgi:hypothetical protein